MTIIDYIIIYLLIGWSIGALLTLSGYIEETFLHWVVITIIWPIICGILLVKIIKDL